MKPTKKRHEAGQAITLLRLLRSKTQKEVEKEARLAAGTLSRWESGRVRPRQKNLQRVLAALEAESVAAEDLARTFESLRALTEQRHEPGETLIHTAWLLEQLGRYLRGQAVPRGRKDPASPC